MVLYEKYFGLNEIGLNLLPENDTVLVKNKRFLQPYFHSHKNPQKFVDNFSRYDTWLNIEIMINGDLKSTILVRFSFLSISLQMN